MTGKRAAWLGFWIGIALLAVYGKIVMWLSVHLR